MNVIADWKRVLRQAWSVRLALLAALLSSVEILVQMWAVIRPTPWFALGAAAVSLAAAVARIVSQPHLRADPAGERMREARGLMPGPGEAMPADVHARLQALLA